MDEYDRLSGGLASAAMDNQLHSLSAESLGLSNLSGDPREIMEALENASKTLDGMKQNVEDALSGDDRRQTIRGTRRKHLHL